MASTRVAGATGAMIALLIAPLCFAQVSRDGLRLAAVLDSMDVEKHWIAGAHVQWRSGEPDGKAVSDEGVHSHCSSFVAAAGDRIGVYILRPPEHSQTFLANAQSDWLDEEGPGRGWTPIDSFDGAQKAANAGMLVVAVYRTKSDRSAGHIAVVRPSEKRADQVSDEGPEIIQAGQENYASTSLRNGFRHHPNAWRRHEVRFYGHAVSWKRAS